MALSITHKDKLFSIGDIVRVHQKIQEDAKTRIQVFEGTVMSIQNSGSGKSFIVRRIGANNVSIERIFPVLSPFIDHVEVKTKGYVRRSKIYFIRDKSARELAEITRPRGTKAVKHTKATTGKKATAGAKNKAKTKKK